jgi:hypothetical protein
MNFWNHYGELELFTSKDKPTDVTRRPAIPSLKVNECSMTNG